MVMSADRGGVLEVLLKMTRAGLGGPFDLPMKPVAVVREGTVGASLDQGGRPVEL